jgi:PAS domain S-box-containing protein
MREGEVDRPVAGGQYAERRRGERRMGRGRRAGEAPRESPAALQELIELAPDAAVVTDGTDHVTDVNAAACTLYGYSREEFLRKTFADLAPDESEREKFVRDVPRIPGRVHLGEWRTKRRDGTLLAVQASTRVLADGRWLMFIRDVSERTRVERERDESLRFMRSVLEQSPVGLALVRGNHVEFNEQAQQMLGQPATTEFNPADSEVRTLDGRRLEPDQLPGARALRGERGVRAEFLVRGAKRSCTPIALSAGPIVGPDGSVLAAVAAFEDITAAKELERLREEWSSVVAHDLRQPLGTISLSAQMIARATGEAKLLRYAEQIRAAAQRLHRMVGDLMDLSRLHAHRLELVRQYVDVPALVSAVAERVALQAPDRAFDVRILEPVPDVVADPDRIAQVMENLLTNAVKYGKGGTVILTTVSSEGGDVAVAVTNEGRPLTAEELSRIFERFHRTASAKLEGIQGVGLGLYITRSLVEAHGGRITAESTPAGVTTFRFTLPVAGPQVASRAEGHP